MKGVSESLAGRVAVIDLLGFSRREMMNKGQEAGPFLPVFADVDSRCQSSDSLDLKNLYQLIWRGSFPAIALDAEMDKELFYSSYVQTYLQRDIRDLARVGDEMAFLRFLRAAAARSGQMLNMTDMARDADVSPNTAKNWLSILQASGIIYLLAPYFTNITKRLVKTPKLYFLDTGLCTYLTGWSSSETLEAGAMSGAILETWIVGELLKSYYHNGRQAPFFYYRDKDKKEIDLLIVRDDIIYPLDFKKSASADKKDIRHFSVLGRLKKKVGPGGLISLGRKLIPLTENVLAIPVKAL
jgi:predicted AAA+ superfamily ATPase